MITIYHVQGYGRLTQAQLQELQAIVGKVTIIKRQLVEV